MSSHLYSKTLGNGKVVSVVHERGRGIAWRIWPGAHVLIDWMEQNVDQWSNDGNVHVVEVGAGVGLVGVVCSGLGAEQVTLTDLPEELDALTRSVSANEAVIHVMPLTFGNEEEAKAVMSRTTLPTVIVGSELIYWESLFQPIADSFRTLIDLGATAIYIGYRIRVWKTEKRFWTKILGQVGLEAEIVGQWFAQEEDGSSQKSDGQVVYSVIPNSDSFNVAGEDWNTRVYKITRAASKVEPDVNPYAEWAHKKDRKNWKSK